jgi:nitrate reductase NapAB chaperone NapD
MLNRYPLWKNLLILAVVLLFGLLALPNLYGEDPAVQISPVDRKVNVDETTLDRVSEALTAIDGVEVHGVNPDGKLVVVIDHPDRGHCSQTAMDMQNIPGVINASLVYDYSGDPDDE